jgi:hypothetical protein
VEAVDRHDLLTRTAYRLPFAGASLIFLVSRKDRRMDAAYGLITRQGMNPVVGHYGFVDPSLQRCTFTLKPSPDGIPGGAATTDNCETLLPMLVQITRWEPDGLGGFWLKGTSPVVCRQHDLVENLRLTIFQYKQKRIGFWIRRLDAPNLRRPTRLAAGWWTFSIKGAPSSNDSRLALLRNGRIGDASQCPGGQLVEYAGGRWSADEGGVTLFGKEPWRKLRYESSGTTMISGTKLISGNYMMVRD